MKILVIGSLNLDTVVRVEEMPAVGETVLGHDLRLLPGGKGANQACAAGKLGGAAGFAAMLGCVGTDAAGDELLQSLSAAGADVSAVRRLPRESSGTALICVDRRGNNSIVVAPGANGCCDANYLRDNAAAFAECEIVLLQLEIPLDAVLYAAEYARALGKTVILNPAPAPDALPGRLLCCADYLTPNETELRHLSGMPCGSDEEIAAAGRALIGRGAGRVLATLGARGAMLIEPDAHALFPSPKVRAVDTTAAGDCFNGAFAVALAQGRTPAEAVRFANAASSLAVTRAGAQTSIPTRSETDAWLCRSAAGSPDAAGEEASPRP